MIQADYDAIAKDYPKWIAENEAPFFTPIRLLRRVTGSKP